MKCEKHDIHLAPPIGCWKCHEKQIQELKEGKSFPAVWGPKIPPPRIKRPTQP